MSVRGKTIPLHRLKETTDQGFQVEKVDIDSREAGKAVRMDTHRDDHYIFLLQESGRSRCMVDFSNYTVKDRAILVILPGQVHRYQASDEGTSGWFVALDVGMMPEMFRTVLEEPLLVQGPIRPKEEALRPVLQTLELIQEISRRQPSGGYDRQVTYGLLQIFVALISSIYCERSQGSKEQAARPRMITQEFRKLLSQRYKELKSPAGYAAQLNLSLSYLNEVVKATTGFAVSYWIQQEVVLEAKRLLYHSTCSIKEIAHQLGYEDHAYFSRMFSKTVGRTPGAFRKFYRE
jgi:AraC-like DNA-binding protein